jgi:calcineurin-like phosphoesterase family protein
MKIAGLYDIFNEKWKDLQTAYIISDLHFGEDDLKKAFPNRPTDEELVKRINAKVGRKDLLIILGDCGDLEYVKKLKGYKVLVAGNHEKGLTSAREVFNEVYAGPVIISEKLILSHEPIAVQGMYNLHGHNHHGKPEGKNDFNFCADINNYEPIHFNSWMKEGHLAKMNTIHRNTINTATKNKKKRGGC